VIVVNDFVILGSGADPNPRSCSTGADERLAAEGWVRRHATDASRLEESIELYKSLGFEVLTRKLTSADYEPSCQGCFESSCPAHVLIYTRKAVGENSSGEAPDDGETQSGRDSVVK
jgi:hypothetical protein